MNDAELARGIEALVVEATRDTPRLTPQQVAALAAAKRREAADAMYRRVPGLYRAVTDVVERFERKQRHRRARRVAGLVWLLMALLIAAKIMERAVS
ncbi:hypothetical protein VW23_021780 [Devosia insulae DS-56]|uniref:Uncharacterized protein n=1 Tax=Devosia insulae DS-56 TaxID=1116389 RepID=A0A1E5XP13_9HYPH|nr:hypothetical protein [Devosia insulae]OEO30350.1 hypothetical protein VW23_021780 [Devosia insulae DS-56]